LAVNQRRLDQGDYLWMVVGRMQLLDVPRDGARRGLVVCEELVPYGGG
jgi:hypothetical protein